MDLSRFSKSIRANGKELLFRTVIPGREWEFVSNSSLKKGKLKTYTVKFNDFVNNVERNNTLSCNCKGWIYNSTRGLKRWCIHLEAVTLSGELTLLQKASVLVSRVNNY